MDLLAVRLTASHRLLLVINFYDLQRAAIYDTSLTFTVLYGLQSYISPLSFITLFISPYRSSYFVSPN